MLLSTKKQLDFNKTTFSYQSYIMDLNKITLFCQQYAINNLYCNICYEANLFNLIRHRLNKYYDLKYVYPIHGRIAMHPPPRSDVLRLNESMQ